jgi:hypothetical protein
MIIYNVTVKVESEFADEWITWMQEEHIPDLYTTGLFAGHRLCRLLEQDEADGVTFSAQYEFSDISKYNRYIDDFAQSMREKAFSRFGGKFVAFRSLMETV